MSLKSFLLNFIKPACAYLGNEAGGRTLLLETIGGKNLIMNTCKIIHTSKLVKTKTDFSKCLKSGHSLLGM